MAVKGPIMTGLQQHSAITLPERDRDSLDLSINICSNSACKLRCKLQGSLRVQRRVCRECSPKGVGRTVDTFNLPNPLYIWLNLLSGCILGGQPFATAVLISVESEPGVSLHAAIQLAL